MHFKAASAPCDPFGSYPLSVSPATGYEVGEFLAWEALLLDTRRYLEWSHLLAQNVVYRCPGRPDDERSYNFTLWHLRDRPAAAVSCAAHTHRCITNVIVTYMHCPREFAVASYVLINYSQPEAHENRTLAVDRRDHIRRAAKGFQIVKREVRMGPISPETRELLGPL